MTGIAIYMEGGGVTASGKASLRQGMSEFLGEVREAARRKNLRWKLTPCGSRTETRDAFLNALEKARDFCNVLLVDSESPVADPSRPIDHLRSHDGWRFDSVQNESIHLMIQTMETWIICDVRALEGFYGQSLATGPLPRARNPELVAKADIAAALERATANAKKGKYHKIHHAGRLLERIDAALVRQCCPSCERLFRTLLDIVVGV